MVSADCASRLGWRRTVSTTAVTSGTFSVNTAAAAAIANPSRWRCGEGEAFARSVNSGVQRASGQKLTM